MQRLIQIRTRDGDEIFDTAGDRMPLIVNDPKRRVAVLHGIGDNPKGEQIIDLVDRDFLAFELLVDGEGSFEPAFDTRRNAFPREF